jgi:hypothetical protein
MNYSDNQLLELAKRNPKELARILTSPNVSIPSLTFGAEILGGEVSDEAITLPVFRMLIKHMNAIVREGVLLGISSFYDGKKPPIDILEKLKTMSSNDPSVAVKDTAKSLLEDFK